MGSVLKLPQVDEVSDAGAHQVGGVGADQLGWLVETCWAERPLRNTLKAQSADRR